MKTEQGIQDTPRGFVGFDFDGTLIAAEIAVEANRRWFAHMADVLGDPAVRAFADPEYRRPVLEVMARLHGKQALTDEERIRYLGEAHDSYTVLVLEILATVPCINVSVLAVLRDLHRQGYRAALISSSASSLVEPALAILDLRRHFDVLMAGTRDDIAAKRALLEEFADEHGRLLCYVGDAEEDRGVCAELNIPFVHVRPGGFRFSLRLLTKP